MTTQIAPAPIVCKDEQNIGRRGVRSIKRRKTKCENENDSKEARVEFHEVRSW